MSADLPKFIAEHMGIFIMPAMAKKSDLKKSYKQNKFICIYVLICHINIFIYTSSFLYYNRFGVRRISTENLYEHVHTYLP